MPFTFVSSVMSVSSSMTTAQQLDDKQAIDEVVSKKTA